ncbi:6331_t:CDS:2 [Entrophospora sp. SA101]|nr:6331_t:CDS:2 [Entrophospora sp. SA101]
MRDLLKFAVHVVAMDVFANESTLTFLRQYQDKGTEAMRKGLWMLQEGKRVVFSMTSCKKVRALALQTYKLRKLDDSPILTHVYFGQIDGKQRQEDFADINATWSGLDCVIYTSTVEAGISFEIPNHFNAIIAISNINTGVHVEAFAQMLYQIHDCPYNNKKPGIFKDPNHDLIHAELPALRPGDLPVAIKGRHEWNKIADCYALDSSPVVETYIEVKYQRRLSVKYFPQILYNLIASTGATLDLVSIENYNLAKADYIDPNEAELLKQIPTRSFADNMILKRYYLWRAYASGNIGDFVKNFNSPKPLQHFRRLAYFQRQGSNAIKALENLKFKETIQWEESQDSLNLASNDLYKPYSVKQWEAVHNLFNHWEKIIKIRQDALLLFGFKPQVKGTLDLNATIKFINAVVGNWCDYAIKTRALILLPYKPESVNEIQELFDSIPITNTNSKFTD